MSVSKVRSSPNCSYKIHLNAIFVSAHTSTSRLCTFSNALLTKCSFKYAFLRCGQCCYLNIRERFYIHIKLLLQPCSCLLHSGNHIWSFELNYENNSPIFIVCRPLRFPQITFSSCARHGKFKIFQLLRIFKEDVKFPTLFFYPALHMVYRFNRSSLYLFNWRDVLRKLTECVAYFTYSFLALPSYTNSQ